MGTVQAIDYLVIVYQNQLVGGGSVINGAYTVYFNYNVWIKIEKAVITFNEWSLDGNSRKMTAPDGQILAIPRGEYRALRLLIENTGQIVTRQQLIKEMTGRDLRSNDRTVDVTIRRLRKHFESVPDSPELINTIHGEGYRFIGSVD